VNVPGALKTFDGLACVDVVPSPKFHVREVAFCDSSLNVNVVTPARPVVGVKLNAAVTALVLVVTVAMFDCVELPAPLNATM
jgi:hypothetical protein